MNFSGTELYTQTPKAKTPIAGETKVHDLMNNTELKDETIYLLVDGIEYKLPKLDPEPGE